MRRPLLTALYPLRLWCKKPESQIVSFPRHIDRWASADLDVAMIRSLPYYPAHLLISAYLASHNPPRHDITVFSKTSLPKRRKKGGGTALTAHRASKHRKISRKLLGPQAFPLERLLAIFHSILSHDVKGGGADVMCMVATLVGLRLVIRAGAGGDVLEGWGKWRCNVGWGFVSNVARSVKFDLESYLVE